MCVHTYVCASFSNNLKYVTKFLLLTTIEILYSMLPLSKVSVSVYSYLYQSKGACPAVKSDVMMMREGSNIV